MSELRVKTRRWLRRLFAPFPYEPYCDRRRCIFVHIPKCAGSSVHAMLSPNERVPRWHAGYELYRTADKRRFESYFKFSVTRNPWDRLYSCYHYLLSGGNGRERDQRMCEWIERDCRDFREFVLDWLEPAKLQGITLLQPQFTFIYDLARQQLMVDELCRFETIERDLPRVMRRLGVERSIPHVNASGTGNFREAYVDARMVDRVRELYPLDVELLGYAFEG